jgi:hypothetical protein
MQQSIKDPGTGADRRHESLTGTANGASVASVAVETLHTSEQVCILIDKDCEQVDFSYVADIKY